MSCAIHISHPMHIYLDRTHARPYSHARSYSFRPNNQNDSERTLLHSQPIQQAHEAGAHIRATHRDTPYTIGHTPYAIGLCSRCQPTEHSTRSPQTRVESKSPVGSISNIIPDIRVNQNDVQYRHEHRA